MDDTDVDGEDVINYTCDVLVIRMKTKIMMIRMMTMMMSMMTLITEQRARSRRMKYRN